MHDYAGNPATFPLSVGLVDDADLNPAGASTLDIAPTNLADRTAWLKANSLNKLGDHIPSGSTITFDSGSTLSVHGEVEIQNDGILQFDAGSTLNGEVDAGTLTLGPPGLLGFQMLVRTHGGIQSLFLGGIQSGVLSGIVASVFGGISSEVPGGFVLDGGPDDWPAFGGAPRSKNYGFIPRAANPNDVVSNVNWGFVSLPGNTPYLEGKATGVAIDLVLENPHEGAILDSVLVLFFVFGGHLSVPAMPTISVKRAQTGGPSLGVAEALSTIDPQPFAPTPASAVAWEAAGATHQLEYICNQNNVIDHVQNTYWIEILDEHGAGALPGNGYFQVIASYRNINDMRFPS